MFKLIFLVSFVGFSFCQQNEQQYKQMVEQLMKMKAEAGALDDTQPSQFDVIIKKIAGSVFIKSSQDGEFKTIEDSSYYPLDPDDTVKTGSDGYAQIYFSDKGMLKLSRNSELEIRDLDQNDASVFLKIGTLIAKFESKLKRKLSFKVHTPTAVCAIRGTEFAAEYSNFNKESAFGVFDEGQIVVSPIDKEGKTLDEVKVEKGQEIVLSPNIKRLKAVRLARLARHKAAIVEVRKKFSLYKNRYRPMDFQKREKMRAALLKRKIKQQHNDRPVRTKNTSKHRPGKRGH